MPRLLLKRKMGNQSYASTQHQELVATMTDFPTTDGCEEPTDVDYEGGLKKRQIVLEFDMATWKVLLC
jgi:hypothetical protein